MLLLLIIFFHIQVVVLWRLAALNPALAPHERDTLHEQFAQWHMKVLDKVNKVNHNVTIL